MTTSTLAAAAPAKPAISFFERYLTVWVALCIVVGIALGQLLPGVFQGGGQPRSGARSTSRWACSSG